MNWATIWAAVSAVFSVVTVGVAVWAMLRWRKQEELKVKLDFKKAIGNYAHCLTQLPVELSSPYVRRNHAIRCQELTDLLGVCNFAWLTTEGLVDSNKTVNECWNFIFNNHQRYMTGEIESTEIGMKCMGIMNERFIFP
ncbi:hypothetical protein [Serratia liquefaciens]|uniref:hypothetical protein n=1 Tax=Serratia liquefaciens TaxID=614 RepID=UPI00301B71E3